MYSGPVVYFNFQDGIDPVKVNKFIHFTTEAVKHYKPSELYFMISSSGGDVDSGFALYNFLVSLQGQMQITMHNAGDAAVMHGNQVFLNIGCETCHKQTVTTGYSPIAALAYQTINPFTDLLVHDMGAADDDHYTEGTALTSEWRTTPLWGLGLAPQVQGGDVYLMHDGRAHSIQEAIQMHGGEAAVSASKFNALTPADQNALISFLQSL